MIAEDTTYVGGMKSSMRMASHALSICLNAVHQNLQKKILQQKMLLKIMVGRENAEKLSVREC